VETVLPCNLARSYAFWSVVQASQRSGWVFHVVPRLEASRGWRDLFHGRASTLSRKVRLCTPRHMFANEIETHYDQ
jgi:hypothetical protein